MPNHVDELLNEKFAYQREVNDLRRRIEKMAVALTAHGLDAISLRVAHLVEDQFAQHHSGGRTQRLAKIQMIIRAAIQDATLGERPWDTWEPGSCSPAPEKPKV